jgi:hypothetical protein
VQAQADSMLRVAIGMTVPGFQRPLDVSEMSDGTLRYLCLIAALLTPRPPELLALNEPETSLHPQLLPPLGRLIARAGQRSQMFVTTHSRELADSIAEHTRARTLQLAIDKGETHVLGHAEDDEGGRPVAPRVREPDGVLRVSALQRSETRFVIVDTSGQLGVGELNDLGKAVHSPPQRVDLLVDNGQPLTEEGLSLRDGLNLRIQAFDDHAEMPLDLFDRLAIHV